MQALVVPVGTDLYAVGLSDVRVILEAPRVTRLPGAPPTLLGVVNVRGQVVPVLDTAALLGLAPLGRATAAVVADSDRGVIALAASAIPRAVTLGESIGASTLPAAGDRYPVGEQEVAVAIDLDDLVARVQA